jgi:hypothetical protein
MFGISLPSPAQIFKSPAIMLTGGALSPLLSAAVVKPATVNNAVVAGVKQSVSFSTGGIIGGTSGVIDFSKRQPGWVRRLGATGTNSLRGGLSNPTIRTSAIVVATYFGGSYLLSGSGGATAGTITATATPAAATGIFGTGMTTGSTVADGLIGGAATKAAAKAAARAIAPAPSAPKSTLPATAPGKAVTPSQAGLGLLGVLSLLLMI